MVVATASELPPEGPLQHRRHVAASRAAAEGVRANDACNSIINLIVTSTIVSGAFDILFAILPKIPAGLLSPLDIFKGSFMRSFYV